MSDKKEKKEKNKNKGFFREFKEFISRGNILDLAVGVIIGAAFGKIVTSLTNDIIMPLITLAMGKSNISELSVILRPAEIDPATGEIITQALTWNWGNFLQTIIDFLIIAFVLFLIVKVMMHMRKAQEKIVDGMKDLAEKLKNDEDENGENASEQAPAVSSEATSVESGESPEQKE